jgi:hypothetical protein
MSHSLRKKVLADGWLEKQSASCQSLDQTHKQECKLIEHHLQIDSKKVDINTSLIHDKLVNILIDMPCNNSSLIQLEKLLQLFITCITSRLQHHKSCHTTIIKKDIENNLSHYKLLKDICSEFAFLYVFYINFLALYNKDSEKHKNKIARDHIDFLRLIKTLLSYLGSDDDKQRIKQIVFKTNKIHSRKHGSRRLIIKKVERILKK